MRYLNYEHECKPQTKGEQTGELQECPVCGRWWHFEKFAWLNDWYLVKPWNKDMLAVIRKRKETT